MDLSRVKQKRIRRLLWACLILFILLSMGIRFQTWLQEKEDPYILIINKSTMTRDILQDRRDGCQYISEKGKKLRPLIIGGKQVCIKGE